MTVRLRPSYQGMRALLTSRQMQAAMGGRAQLVDARARETAPVHSGEYRDSFTVTTGIRADGKRAVGTVTNDSPHAHLVEFGSKDFDGQYILTNALDAAL